MESNQELKFLTNNVKGLRSIKKRIKLFEFYKKKITSNGIIFLQETHSSTDDIISWKDDFNGELIFFGHGTTNSCGVLTGYYGNKTFLPKMIKSDENGRILIIEATIDEEDFILINLYNANTEKEQLETFENLLTLLDSFSFDDSKKIVFAGDLNLFFDPTLEASGGNPTLKKNSISKIHQILEQFDLLDIWRIRNLETKRFTFRQKHFSGYIQRRLDYIFISSEIQELVQKIDIIPALSSDHSPVFLSLSKSTKFSYGKNFWKFNSSLVNDTTYIKEMKQHILDTKNQLYTTLQNLNDHLKWEYLKYKVRNFTINFSKLKAKNERVRKNMLEERLNILEGNLDSSEKQKEYNLCKEELNSIYDSICEGIIVRSRCNWYEEGEKSSKYFLNLEKKRFTVGVVKKLILPT